MLTWFFSKDKLTKQNTIATFFNILKIDAGKLLTYTFYD